jgi:hypothetical protein
MTRIFFAIATITETLNYYLDVKHKFDHWKPNILLSYAFKNVFREIGKIHCNAFRFFLDSGAYTAFTKNKHVDFNEYCSFVKDPPFPIERYFQLDVIGDVEATRRNYFKMLDKGLNPIPIFTRGAALEQLDKFYETSDLIGIGALVKTNNKREYLKWISEQNKRPVHWLGFGDIDFILKYQPYSCDVTTPLNPLMYGYGHIVHNHKLQRFDRYNFKKLLSVKKLCEKYELDFNELNNKNAWKNTQAGRLSFKISLYAWFEYTKKLEEMKGSVI